MAAKKPKPAAGQDDSWISRTLGAAAKQTEKSDAIKRMLSTGMPMSEVAKSWQYIDFVDPRTGLPILPFEWIFGARGLLIGRMFMFNAAPSVGKSSLCYALYGMGQYGCGALPIHCESEFAPHPPHYVASYGCNPRGIMLLQPSSMDMAFSMSMESAKLVRDTNPEAANAPIINGYDSISGFGAAELEGDAVAGAASDNALGTQARNVSKFFREGGAEQLARDKIVMLCVAQTKAKIAINTPSYMLRNMPERAKETCLAENALAFAASTRLRLTGKELKSAEEKGRVIGTLVTIETTKNKVNESNKAFDIALIRNQGFDYTGASYDFIRQLAGKDGFKITHGEMAGRKLEMSLAGGRIDCPLVLGDEKLPTASGGPAEFVTRFYDNQPLLASVRESLRIMGFGFDFETKYEVHGANDVAKAVPDT